MPQLQSEYATESDRVALSLNWIISSAVLSDYNHVDLKNSMTVALDFYTLFSIYIYCSGLTVFLILHVHANKEIMEYMTLYKCALFVLWRPWWELRAAAFFPPETALFFKKASEVFTCIQKYLWFPAGTHRFVTVWVHPCCVVWRTPLKTRRALKCFPWMYDIWLALEVEPHGPLKKVII